MDAHMGTDGGKGIAIPYDLQCFHHPPLGNQINVFSNLHMQGTSILARRHERMVKRGFLNTIAVVTFKGIDTR